MRTPVEWPFFLVFALAIGCGAQEVAPEPVPVAPVAARASGTVCDSSQHETSELASDLTFDLGCAIEYLRSAGCDFALDPNADGRSISSSTIEDLQNDPANCQSGSSCSGCADADTIDTIDDCQTLAGTSYFTEGAWKDLAAQCPASAPDPGEEEPAGCAMEGVQFNAEEMACGLQFFTGMSCDACTDLLDSRVCEDAINDPLSCQAGSACTGCEDGDSRANGVDCEEVAAYSYFGPAAAETLLAHVQAHPCGGGAACVPACDGRTCGDDGCGGSCGTCASHETCGTDGQCAAGGCMVEGVVFDHSAIDCALAFFEGMDCTTCVDVFDSRICEDAINDAGMCQVGTTCTGCDDDDTREDGVTCEEIERYAYFGNSAAHKLLTYVRNDYSCGAPAYIYEGVPLTGEEVAEIIELANLGTYSELDDGAGLDSRAVDGIIAARPIGSMPDFAGIPYLGKTAMEKLRDFAMTWSPAGAAIHDLTIAQLADEAATNGTASPYNNQVARVSRAIITSVPSTTGGGGLLFYVADPSAGNLEQLKVYIAASASQDTGFASIFDDITLTGKFTKYGNYFELLLDDPTGHSLALNKSGLAYADYADIEAAWHSTAANPEGVVRVPSTFGYTYMVPLPLFLDHPMWGDSPPGPPHDSGNEQDHAWNAAAGDALDAWRAGN
jgi:hypothetical protein